MIFKKILTASLLGASFIGLMAQSFIPAYSTRANQVTQTNVNTLLQEFEALGIKKTGTVANENALQWIKAKYLNFGYSAGQIVEDAFSYNNGMSTVNSKNLVITKTGTTYPNTFVIICGHFDTINGPGVDDNGSGTAAILEVARILKDVPTEYSIKFIHFSGEEQGLKGSAHYVNSVVNATNPKMNIKLVFNLDQVGGKIGNNNNTIYCDQDMGGLSSNNAASQAITLQLANCTTLYSPLLTAYDPAANSDYIPFEQNGEIITGFYEYTRGYLEHSANDTLANVDKVYVKNVAMASVGAAQHFAVAQSTLATSESSLADDQFQIYPIPTQNVLNIDFVEVGNAQFIFDLIDASGRLVMTSQNQKQIDVTALDTGIYIGRLKIKDKIFQKKIIIKK